MRIKVVRKISFLLLILLSFQIILSAQDKSEELTWPREFTVKKYKITVYQPQLESFEKNILQGRIAISIKPEDKDIVFCAAWFESMMETDFDERTVTLDKMKITKVHFPDYDNQEMIDKLSRVLEKQFESWDITMSLDRLVASLETVDNLEVQSESLKNDPPEIYFRTEPTTLISIDGEPIIKEVEKPNVEYVVNTPFFIVKEKGESTYYIKGGKFWYQSDKITEGWKPTEDVPSHVLKFATKNMEKT